MAQITLQNAVIEHRHGVNMYTGKDEDDIKNQVAEYCREWWDDEMEDYDQPEDRDELIELYFGENSRETVHFGESIVDEEWLPTPFKQLTEEESKKCEFAYIEMESGFHIAIDATWLDQVENDTFGYKLKLPTGEVLDFAKIK